MFILDCRNIYENKFGTFKNSIPLETNVFSETFNELDKIIQNNTSITKDKRILTFCTGNY